MSTPKLRFKEFSGDWDNTTVEKLGYFTSGGTPSKENTAYWLGSIPWISSSDVTDENIFSISITRFISQEAIKNSSTKLIPKNSILLVSRVGVGKVAINNRDLCTSQDFTALTPSHGNTIFLAYLLKGITPKLLELNQGTSIKGFVRNDLISLNVNIPSKPEQTKIATFLTTVDEKISQLSQKQELLAQYKKGMMQKLFSQQIRFKADDGSEFEAWETKKLGTFAMTFSGGTPTSSNKDYYNGDIPFIKSGEISSSFTEQFINKKGLDSSSAKIINQGDLLYALYGATSGQVAISQIKGAINQAVLCIRSEQNNAFLYNFFLLAKSDILSTYLQGGQGNLSAQILKNIEIPLPTLAEQTKIANFLSAIDQKIDTTTQQLEQAKQWKKGLLQQMFV